VQLCELQPGDTAEVPFWPGRVTVEDVTWLEGRLGRIHWVSSDAEGCTTLSLGALVTRAGRFADYATRPAYVSYGATFAALDRARELQDPPPPERDGLTFDDDALAMLREKLEG